MPRDATGWSISASRELCIRRDSLDGRSKVSRTLPDVVERQNDCGRFEEPSLQK